MDAERFVSNLSQYKGSGVFNPYSDTCPLHDADGAPAIRSSNLQKVLDAFFESGADSVWIGRDLGHRGGRRTGLALTDEINLASAGEKWGVDLRKATHGDSVAERTAACIWSHANRIQERVFMWNVFPFHPHAHDKPLTNRPHTARERDIGMEILEFIVTRLNPSRIVAIGNDAFQCAAKLRSHRMLVKVRHPSYGGEKEFSEQILSLHGLKTPIKEEGV